MSKHKFDYCDNIDIREDNIKQCEYIFEENYDEYDDSHICKENKESKIELEMIDFENKLYNSCASFIFETNEYNYFHCLENKVINTHNIDIFDFLEYMNGDKED